MKVSRFMREYANCIKRTIRAYESIGNDIKWPAVTRIDRTIRDYSRGFIGLVDAMNEIGAALEDVQQYVY